MKKQKGITLIALVITIIVLLILAGVSISMIVGNNGVLTQALGAVTENRKAAAREEIALVWASIDSEFWEDWTKDTSKQKSEYFTEANLNKYLEDTGTVSSLVYNASGISTLRYTSKADGLVYELEIDTSGTATVIGEPSQGDGEEGPEGGSTETVVGMYEDLAGDEEGATEGKIHIGDYVNYNANPSNMATSAMTEANGYKYVSANSETGLADAISASYSGLITTVTEQVFTVQPNLKWRVIGMDGSNLLITTETPIIPDSPVTAISMLIDIDKEETGYFIYGAKAYENCITEITNISKIYANGEGAVKELSRGMTITDVDNITGVVANGTTVTPAGVNLYDGESGVQPYGTQLTEFKKGTKYGWTPSAWLTASAADRQDATKAPGITEKVSAYYYEGSNSALKTASSAIRSNLVFGASNANTYWLASRGFYVSAEYADYGPGAVGYGMVTSGGGGFNSHGYSYGSAGGVRPVVALESNITLTAVSTADGITTWNIE